MTRCGVDDVGIQVLIPIQSGDTSPTSGPTRKALRFDESATFCHIAKENCGMIPANLTMRFSLVFSLGSQVPTRLGTIRRILFETLVDYLLGCLMKKDMALVSRWEVFVDHPCEESVCAPFDIVLVFDDDLEE